MAKLSSLDLTTRANVGTTFTPHLPVLDAATGEYKPILGADGTPATITLLGADSDVAKRLTRRQRAHLQNRMSALAFRGEKQDGLTEEDIAAQEEHDLEIVVACTAAWSGFEDDHDVPLPCTESNVRALYVSAPYLVEQAMRHLRDRGRFFVQSSTLSDAPLSIGSD
jgi:hypothetical protein